MIKARFKKRLLGSRDAFDLNINLEIKEAEVVASERVKARFYAF